MNGSYKEIKFAEDLKRKFENALKDISKEKFDELVSDHIDEYGDDIEDFSYSRFRNMFELIQSVESSYRWIYNYKYYKFNDKFIREFISSVELFCDEEEWIDFLKMWGIEETEENLKKRI